MGNMKGTAKRVRRSKLPAAMVRVPGITRKMYLDAMTGGDRGVYRTYHAQFVTPEVLELVNGQQWVRDGLEDLLESGTNDPNLELIPVDKWSSLHHAMLKLVGRELAAASEVDELGAPEVKRITARHRAYVDESQTVSVAKEAARQVFEAMGGKLKFEGE